MNSRIVTLREERTKNESRSLRARLSESGDLRIEGQDFGSGVEGFWGAGLTEYEWVITMRAAQFPRLVAALGGNDGDDVLTLLSQRYSENAHYASRTFFDQQEIPTEFWSRVGD